MDWMWIWTKVNEVASNMLALYSLRYDLFYFSFAV